MPRLVSPDGDAVNLTAAEYEFLRSVHQELTEARQRGQDPVVCLFFEAGKRPAGTVFVPPAEPPALDYEVRLSPVGIAAGQVQPPGEWEIASQMPALGKPRSLESASNGCADLEDEQEEDREDMDSLDDPDETTATDDTVLQVLAECPQPLKRAAIAKRGGIKDGSYLSERIKRLVERKKVRRLRGHVYWCADRTLPPTKD